MNTVTDLLDDFQSRACKAIERFNEHFGVGRDDISKPIRTALQDFYLVVIRFYLVTASLSKTSRIGMFTWCGRLINANGVSFLASNAGT